MSDYPQAKRIHLILDSYRIHRPLAQKAEPDTATSVFAEESRLSLLESRKAI